jgi:A/G-specific adenine glycosylase
MFINLISWSKKHYSDLPWRTNRTLYGTLVSEIMLQQTTVGTVKNHFDRFLKKFPTIKSLADTTEEELLIQWKGLGYYRRAKNLKKICMELMKSYKGKFPQDELSLLKLNGVGPYTANALLSIGMDRKALAVDANIERVLSRFYGIELEKGSKLSKEIYIQFKENKILNLKNVSYRELNEALMDLGRVYCKSMTVECQNCPVNKGCVAYKNRTQLKFPISSKTKKEVFEIEVVRFLIVKEKKYLAYLKNEKEWLHGQWELPTFILKSSDKKLVQYPILTSKIDTNACKKFKTTITKYKITNWIFPISLKEFQKISKDPKYFFRELNDKSNFSTTTMKCLAKL